jgi:(p)ppGpp synthase/HD superfamily hydrolase
MVRVQEIQELNSLEAKAKNLALHAHKDQTYGEHPYAVHLADVVARVKTITQDPEIIAAAWLHDVIEDTSVTRSEIVQQFGTNVADMVWAVTGHGKNRKERLADVISKIAQTPGSDLVKSADRLSNVSFSLANDPLKLKMYRGEHDNLISVLGNNKLAQELVRLFSD